MSRVCPGCGRPIRSGEGAYCGTVPNWHWDCREAALARGRARSLMEQVVAAQRLFTLYTGFARSIGCRVDGDAIECTDDQAKQLARWWNDETRRNKK